jgi:hypothetical protein
MYQGTDVFRIHRNAFNADSVAYGEGQGLGVVTGAGGRRRKVGREEEMREGGWGVRGTRGWTEMGIVAGRDWKDGRYLIREGTVYCTLIRILYLNTCIVP